MRLSVHFKANQTEALKEVQWQLEPLNRHFRVGAVLSRLTSKAIFQIKLQDRGKTITIFLIKVWLADSPTF